MPSTPPSQEASLHRQLRLRDLVLTQVLCVVGSSWVGIAAGLVDPDSVVWTEKFRPMSFDRYSRVRVKVDAKK